MPQGKTRSNRLCKLFLKFFILNVTHEWLLLHCVCVFLYTMSMFNWVKLRSSSSSSPPLLFLSNYVFHCVLFYVPLCQIFITLGCNFFWFKTLERWCVIIIQLRSGVGISIMKGVLFQFLKLYLKLIFTKDSWKDKKRTK